ncbi:DUF6221 family protein, partial [Desertihabitans aurantiacus]|uniref:DUF6221 family protein n=1 Tax=Desertihabitans aurantiacus TaxID=2282477 RepID=UPI001E2F6FBA
ARAAAGPRWVPAVAPDDEGGVGAWLVTLPHRGDPRGPGPRVATTSGHPEQEHVVRWDPARVLAECAVKRQLVHTGSEEVLRTLAAPWSRHPDADGLG